MSVAFEVTEDDVFNVFAIHKIPTTDEVVNEVLEKLPYDKIETGLLHFTCLSAQTESAQSDIEDFLMENGYLDWGEKKFSNKNAQSYEDGE